MSNYETSGQESDGCTDLEVTVCDNGVVNVHRPESARAHSVMVDVTGDVVRCSCKGHHYRGTCAHADAIEQRPLVVSSALAAAATYHDGQDSAATNDADAARALATDGGHVESAESETTETDGGDELPAIVDCDDDPHRARCEGCGATGPKGLGDDGPAILHDRDCPRADSDVSLTVTRDDAATLALVLFELYEELPETILEGIDSDEDSDADTNEDSDSA